MNSTKKIIGLLCLVFALSFSSVNAQQTGFLGEVKMFAGNFAPRGWAYCQGQLLAINQYTALFSILGTKYGGDGRTTFALPDYRGRIARGTGDGPGLDPAPLGQKGGIEYKTLNILEMPIHNHGAVFTPGPAGSANISISIPAIADAGNTDDPEDAILAMPALGSSGGTAVNLYSKDEADVNLKPFNAATTVTASGTVSVANAGGSQRFDIRQPYTTINYIICIEGVFPSRN